MMWLATPEATTAPRETACRPGYPPDPARVLVSEAPLSLPLPEGEPAFSGQAASPTPRRAVLVVDDEPNVRFLIAEVLDDLNYAFLEAVDGPSALQIVGSDQPIDLMITDVGLPGRMNGRHLAAAARAARPGLAILFITGYAETAALGDGALEPGTMVLTKPFSIDALASRVKDLMA